MAKSCKGCVGNGGCHKGSKEYCLNLNRKWYVSKQRMIDAGLYDHLPASAREIK